MKKLIATYPFVLLLVVILISCTNVEPKKMITNEDYVPDKETAIKIAEAIWLPIYGEKIYESKPFEAQLKGDSLWVVEGTLKEKKGGVPYIEIRKSDCKIIIVTHGK